MSNPNVDELRGKNGVGGWFAVAMFPRVRSLRGMVLEDGVSSTVLPGNRIGEGVKARGKLKGDRRMI